MRKVFSWTTLQNDSRLSPSFVPQGPERPWQAAVVRWNRRRVPRLSIQWKNTHEPRQFCFSRADGQMRSRAESDLPNSRESAGRSTLEVLHADVLCIGLDNERQCTNPDPIRGGNKRSRGMATETQSTRARHSKSTICPDAEDHDACETFVDHAEGFWIMTEILGAARRRVGTRFRNCVGRCSQSTQWWWFWPRFFLEKVCSWVHMPTAQLFVQPCCNGVTPSDRVIWKWNECRWWQDASWLSQER